MEPWKERGDATTTVKIDTRPEDYEGCKMVGENSVEVGGRESLERPKPTPGCSVEEEIRL